MYLKVLKETEVRPAGVQPKRESKLLTVIGLTTIHAVCRIVSGARGNVVIIGTYVLPWLSGKGKLGVGSIGRFLYAALILRSFDRSLSQGYFPSSWKEANVTPIHKKKDKSLPKNYTPISLLSHIGKTMERCMLVCTNTFITT